MGKKKVKHSQPSAIKQVVRTPMFRKRVEEDATKYNRKRKHKGREDSWLKAFLLSVFSQAIYNRV